jgi:hypothetical protein
MKTISRIAAVIAIASALMGCAVYATPAPGPVYYGYHGGWHHY